MKFFTLEMYDNLSSSFDNEHLWDAAVIEYQNHVRGLRGRLPDSVLEFAGQSEIADALLSKVRYDREKHELDLTLRCGYMPIGYCDLISHHKGAEITPEDEFELATIARATRTAGLFWGYDGFWQEVDLATDGKIEHRFLFHNRVTFTIRCTSLEWQKIPRADRDLPRMKDRFPGGPPTPAPTMENSFGRNKPWPEGP